MTETEIKNWMDVFTKTANDTSVTELLNLLGKYMNAYHAHGLSIYLIKMNDIMMILLLKHGLMDADVALQDANFVIRQREMFETILQSKS
jgi:hypothetical protein